MNALSFSTRLPLNICQCTVLTFRIEGHLQTQVESSYSLVTNSKPWQSLKGRRKVSRNQSNKEKANSRQTRAASQTTVSNQWTRTSRSVWLTFVTCVPSTWGAITEWFFGSDTIKWKKCFQTHLSKFLRAWKLSAWAADSFSPSTSSSSCCSEASLAASGTQQCLTGSPKPRRSECRDAPQDPEAASLFQQCATP